MKQNTPNAKMAKYIANSMSGPCLFGFPDVGSCGDTPGKRTATRSKKEAISLAPISSFRHWRRVPHLDCVDAQYQGRMSAERARMLYFREIIRRRGVGVSLRNTHGTGESSCSLSVYPSVFVFGPAIRFYNLPCLLPDHKFSVKSHLGFCGDGPSERPHGKAR